MSAKEIVHKVEAKPERPGSQRVSRWSRAVPHSWTLPPHGQRDQQERGAER